MQSDAVALAIFGNSLLQGYPCPEFWPKAQVFRWARTISFEAKVGRFLAAEDPTSWVEQLRDHGVFGFHAHWTGGNRIGEAFAGGGSSWLVEALREGGTEHWFSRWKLLDLNDPGNRNWEARYVRLSQSGRDCPMSLIGLDTIREQLRQAIDRALSLLRSGKVEGLPSDVRWLNESLRTASELLDADDPQPGIAYAELGCETPLSLPARQILASSERAWLFGGAGSWNDISVKPEATEEYSHVSELLYRTLMDAVCEAANTHVAR